MRAELERAARKRKTVNAAGQVVTGDPRANDLDAQLLRKGIRGQTLPVGGCGRLIVLGGCPHANTCVTCTYWLTSTDDLPAVVLVNGSIQGVWQSTTRRSQTVVKVHLFCSPSAVIQKGIEAEVERLSVFFKTKVVLEYEHHSSSGL